MSKLAKKPDEGSVYKQWLCAVTTTTCVLIILMWMGFLSVCIVLLTQSSENLLVSVVIKVCLDG